MTALRNFRSDSFVSGLAIKAPVKAATNAAVTLSGEQTVNGIALLAGDRVLVKDQVDPIENGIYVVETSAWQRAGDWDGERDVVGGSVVPAYDQTNNAIIQWVVDGDANRLSPTVDAMSFTLFYDPVGSGQSVPVSTQASSILRGDGAGGWVEEADLTISSVGTLVTTGAIALSDGVDTATLDASSGNLLLTGSGGFGHMEVFLDVRLRDAVYILERAGADTGFTGYGQWWVRSSDGAPMFTTDAGVDYQLNTAPSFSPPIVLLDDEQIEFGTAAPDVTMEFDSTTNGILLDPIAINTPFALNNAMDFRLYNQTGLAYVQFRNDGIVGLNSLDITASISGSVSYDVGPWDFNDHRVLQPFLDDYAIQDATAGSVSGVLDIDFEDGNSHYLALTENVTTMTLSNPPISGRLGQVEIEILQDSVARTIAWPAAVKWPGGTAPDLSTTNATYLVHLRTRDGGTSYLGSFLENFS
jgi:hypothetical protein